MKSHWKLPRKGVLKRIVCEANKTPETAPWNRLWLPSRCSSDSLSAKEQKNVKELLEYGHEASDLTKYAIHSAEPPYANELYAQSNDNVGLMSAKD